MVLRAAVPSDVPDRLWPVKFSSSPGNELSSACGCRFVASRCNPSALLNATRVKLIEALRGTRTCPSHYTLTRCYGYLPYRRADRILCGLTLIVFDLLLDRDVERRRFRRLVRRLAISIVVSGISACEFRSCDTQCVLFQLSYSIISSAVVEFPMKFCLNLHPDFI